MTKDTTTCTVIMDGVTTTTNDFVAIISTEDGDTNLLYNTDALTLGIAMKMVSRAFVEQMGNLTEEEREQVTDILQGTPIIEELAGTEGEAPNA